LKYNFFLLLFFSFSLFSQKNQILDEVIVSETKINMPFSKKYRSIEIINESEIKESGAQNIIDLLQQYTGLDIRRRGAGGVQADLYIRGGGFDQTLLLVDGMKMDDSQTGHHTLNMLLPVELIKRIEIIKGPAARIFGQNAFNGAINIVTKSARKTLNSQLNISLTNISGGSFDNLSSSVTASLSNNDYSALINYAQDKSDGYRYNTDYKTNNLFIKSNLSRSNPHTTIISSISNRKFGANGFYASPEAIDQYEETQTSLVGFYSTYRKGNLVIKPKVYWRRNQDEYIYIRNNPSIYRNLHKTNKIALQTDFNYYSNLGKTSFGIDISNISITSNNLGDHSRFTTSVYIDHTIRLLKEKLTLSPGLSISYFSDLSFHSFPGFDIGFDFSESFSIYGNFGKTYRIPTYTDLYYKDRTTIGNSELEPENATNSEFGFKFNSDKIVFKTAVFNRKSKNIIDYVKQNENDLWQATNIGLLKTSGIESDILIKLSRNINFKFGYAYINDDNYVSNIKFSRYSLNSLKHNFISKLSLKYSKKLYHNIIFRYSERLDLTNYRIVDTNISYKPFSKNAELYLNLNNIFDQYYWETNLVPMPGKNFIIGYRSSF
jgi:iron complex outermembrane receptor protein